MKKLAFADPLALSDLLATSSKSSELTGLGALGAVELNSSGGEAGSGSRGPSGREAGAGRKIGAPTPAPVVTETGEATGNPSAGNSAGQEPDVTPIKGPWSPNMSERGPGSSDPGTPGSERGTLPADPGAPPSERGTLPTDPGTPPSERGTPQPGPVTPLSERGPAASDPGTLGSEQSAAASSSSSAPVISLPRPGVLFAHDANGRSIASFATDGSDDTPPGSGQVGPEAFDTAVTAPGDSSVTGVHGPLSGNQMINGLLWDGWKWDSPNTTAVIISYWFGETADYVENGVHVGATKAWTAEEKASYVRALQAYSDVANVAFVESATEAGANFREYLVTAAQMSALTGSSGVVAYHYTPQNVGFFGNQASGVYNYQAMGAGGWTNAQLADGSYFNFVIAHELGHAMGLKHPFDQIGSAPVFPGVTSSSSLGDNNLSHAFSTVMAYNTHYTFDVNGNVVHGSGNPTHAGGNYLLDHGYQSGLGALDIAAIQFLYGANTNFHNSSDLYTLPDVNAAGTVWQTIWDTGGTDELRYTGTRNVILDLNAAPIANVANGGGALSYAASVYGGFTIANGVVIENATAGNGNDLVVGNAVDNTLLGNRGNDILRGGAGNDFIFGHQDNDTLFGGANDDVLFGGVGNDTMDGVNGSDTASYADIFGPVTVSLLLMGTQQNTGSGGLDTLFNIDHLEGAVFDSSDLSGDNNANTLRGGFSGDTLRGGQGNDTLYGLDDNDTLLGGANDDLLEGGNGADTINGVTGNDTASYFDAGGAVTVSLLLMGSQQNTGADGLDTLFNIDNLTGSKDFGSDLSGDNNANTIIGGNGADTLRGGQGNDTLRGGQSSDTIFGGANNDTIYGGADSDTLTGGLNNDTFWFIRNQASGDIIMDFAGNGAGAGDLLRFQGYTAGTTFTQVDSTHWRLDDGDEVSETITFANGAAIHATDFAFV